MRQRGESGAERQTSASQGVTITHPEKILFPDAGITKGELAGYYEMIAPLMLPHMRNRPVTMERYPQGIESQSFWQKDVSRGFPEWLQRVDAPKKDGVVHHPIVTDTRSLLWLANQNSITPHVWTSRAPDLYQPDVCVFDLDPSRDDPADVRSAALALRDLIGELGPRELEQDVRVEGISCRRFPSTARRATAKFRTSRTRWARCFVRRHPKTLTQEFSKADRGGRILVDTGRNGYRATFAAAYAVRARPGAPVSAPCTWREVEAGDVEPRSLTLRTMAERVGQVGDLWSDMARHASGLQDATERLRGMAN